jgi:hypothetical protein
MLNTIVRIVVLLLFAGCITSSIVFDIESSRLGGDAINGKIEAGRYYVGSHGRYTEVSREKYERSRWHTHLAWATLLFFGAAFLTAWIVEKRTKVDRKASWFRNKS